MAAATLKESVEIFQKKYPDVEVKVEDFGSGDLYEKLTVGLAARGSGLPDVVLMEDERIPGYTHQFPQGFLPLNKLGYDKYKDSFNPAKVAAVQDKDGNMIAAPWLLSHCIRHCSLVGMLHNSRTIKSYAPKEAKINLYL